ncbi:hypothetical protein PGB90_004401 [Kerria lacca]
MFIFILNISDNLRTYFLFELLFHLFIYLKSCRNKKKTLFVKDENEKGHKLPMQIFVCYCS